jgi:murein DD-endopeptidase MepM/ murein hydrolase activator NlpD
MRRALPARAFACVACSALLGLLVADAAQAARFWRWRDANGVTHYGDTPPPGAKAEAAAERSHVRGNEADGKLRLVKNGSHYEAWADNRLPGPLQVQLRLRAGENISLAPSLPVQATVPASGSVLVARVYPTDPRLASNFDLGLDYLPGDPRARPLDYAYRLPVGVARARVDQGFGGSFSHNDAQNLHALDFAVAEGTPVLAAREGIVLQVQSDYAAAGLDRERYGTRANFVRILHADGSMALYGHLKPDGVLVRPGQQVRQGQQIALSGNTGYSSAPHLHFVVQLNRGMRLESIPIRMFGPEGELRFAREVDTLPPARRGAP